MDKVTDYPNSIGATQLGDQLPDLIRLLHRLEEQFKRVDDQKVVVAQLADRIYGIEPKADNPNTDSYAAEAQDIVSRINRMICMIEDRSAELTGEIGRLLRLA